MRELLFLAPFPNERYKMDGMISRIKTIDGHFKAQQRTYLYVSLLKNRKKYYEAFENVEVFELNLFLHFFLIIRVLFSAKKIYSHSIYQIRHIWFMIPFYQGHIYLDAHGVVPEEIKYFEGSELKFRFMNMVEAILFKKEKLTVICVTNAMKKHFTQKYPNFNGSFLIYSIFPENLFQEMEAGIPAADKVTILYSGGNAGWQNIPLMLEVIKASKGNHFKYIILSSDLDYFKAEVAKLGLAHEDITINRVHPSELGAYYAKADYGFILRDDNVVNTVANPTKLVEYLSYGIIPVVLTPNIGDYLENGYEYILYTSINKSLKKPLGKNLKNISIAQKLIKDNAAISLAALVLNTDK